MLCQRNLPLAPGAMGFASEMVCGGDVLMVLAAASGESMTWPPQPLAFAAWAYLVIFGSLIAFNAYMLLLARASAGLASSYTERPQCAHEPGAAGGAARPGQFNNGAIRRRGQ